MLVEVAAHARWITALDLAPDSGRLLSVGEDSIVRVWQIAEEQPMVGIPKSFIPQFYQFMCDLALLMPFTSIFFQIEHRFYSSIRDSLLVGGRFLTSNGSTFCLSSYDSCEVYCFQLS